VVIDCGQSGLFQGRSSEAMRYLVVVKDENSMELRVQEEIYCIE